MKQKELYILAGPNGTGKTTLSSLFLESKKNLRFINADVIAKGLDLASKEGAEIEAGKVMLSTIKQAINSGESFGFETTLSGRIWLNYIQEAKKLGYAVSLYFVIVADVETCLERISKRVLAGGHFVPNETVIRRFDRSKNLFWNLYKDKVDNWLIFDNPNNGATLIARKESGVLEIYNQELLDRYFKDVRKTS